MAEENERRVDVVVDGGAERGVGYCNKDQEETTKETGRAKKVRQK